MGGIVNFKLLRDNTALGLTQQSDKKIGKLFIILICSSSDLI